MNANDFRRIALGMRGAIESSHMGHPDFRVNNRIFATLHDGDRFGMVKLTPEDQKKVDEMSKLSGHEFDRAYMNVTLQNHESTLEEFQQHLSTMRYPDLREWFTSTLPALKAHRDQARLVKSSLQTSP